MFLSKVVNSLSVLWSVIKTNGCGLVTIVFLVNNALSPSGFILFASLNMTVKWVTKHLLSELCELCWHADVKRRVISRWREPGALVGLSCLNKHWRAVASTQQWGLCFFRELKVATGEWFLEERSKRFDQGATSSDVIKQNIMSTPCCEFSPNEYQSWGSAYGMTVLSSVLWLAADNKSTENISVNNLETLDTPKSNRSAIHSMVNGARRRGWATQTVHLKCNLFMFSVLLCYSSIKTFVESFLFCLVFFTAKHWSSGWSVEQMLTLFSLVRHSVFSEDVTQEYWIQIVTGQPKINK